MSAERGRREDSPITARELVFRMIHARGSRAHAVYQTIMSAVVVMNLVTIMLATVEEFRAAHYPWLHRFEVCTSLVFLAELLLVLWSRRAGGLQNQQAARFLSSLAVIDALGFLPLLLRVFTSIDIRYVRAIRLLRLLRLLYHDACSRSLELMWRVLRGRRSDMAVAGFLVFMLLVISSSAMYFIEHEAQPKAFSSIPESLWWGVMTLTTIGYGDIVPVTTAGRVVTSFIGLLGVGIVALPASIFTAGLIEELQARRKGRRCPHCGRDVDADPQGPPSGENT